MLGILHVVVCSHLITVRVDQGFGPSSGLGFSLDPFNPISSCLFYYKTPETLQGGKEAQTPKTTGHIGIYIIYYLQIFTFFTKFGFGLISSLLPIFGKYRRINFEYKLSKPK